MAKTEHEIEAELLALPEDVRAQLVDALIESLVQDEPLDAAVIAEIERRREEVLQGKAELIDNDEVFARAEARLR